jgi:tRNA G18 (ribose-2'-O)-methylase SpoU
MNRKVKNIELNRLSPDAFKHVQKLPLCLILDGIRSLQNVGSIFRTADAFAIEAVYLCGITGTPPHKEIHKTALGSEESVNWFYEKDIVTCLQNLKKREYLIASLEQTTESTFLHEFVSPKPIALILGNEVDGVSDVAIAASDICLEIEQFGTKHSLNVSVSAGIALWHISQMLQNKV